MSMMTPERVLKEVLFSPQNITEYHKSYDYVEALRKDATPVLSVETPWEVQKGIQWASIVRSRVDGKYRLWYQSGFRREAVVGDTIIDNTTHFPWRKVVCYAESVDGSNWTRPLLNRFLVDAFPDNNIVLDWDGFLLDSPSVIEDVADPDPARRYKMLVFHQDNSDPSVTGGCLFTSPDGIEFRFTGHVFPTQDAECLWYDPIHRRYLAFLKERYGENRIRMLSHSSDCITWSEPHVLFKPDAGDNKGTNFYQQSAFTLSGRCMGFLNVYDVTTQMSWLELVESPDGLSWNRLPSKSAVLKQGDFGAIDGGGVYCGLSEPIVEGDKTWVYYFAAPHPHDSGFSEQARHLKQCIARAWFPTERLVGQQSELGGYFASVPVLCPGGRLELNFRCANQVRVELKNPGYSAPIAGYTAADCIPMTGDDKSGAVRWKHGRTLHELAGRYLKIKVYGDNMKVFCARFVTE